MRRLCHRRFLHVSALARHLRHYFLFSPSSGARMGSAPFALFPRVIRAPVFGRAYSAAPTLFHADHLQNSTETGGRRSQITHLTERSSQPLPGAMASSKHVYEVRPRKDKRGVDLISDVLPFGRLWYGEPDAISDATSYARFSAAHTML
jgi:hypothetical protein